MSNICDHVARAVVSDQCTLTPAQRHLVLTLAQLATWRTGRGIAGQGRIARAMGVDARTVRRLKASLAAAKGSPVAVTWAHRSRPDGLNGSDSYRLALTELGEALLGLSVEGDTGQYVRDTGQPGMGHRTLCPTNITTGSPRGVTPESKKEESEVNFSGEGPQAPPSLKLTRVLVAAWRGPNVTHARSSAKQGIEGERLAEVEAEFRGYWTARGGSKSQLEWAAAFGGWLKRQRPSKQEPAAAVAAPDVAPDDSGSLSSKELRRRKKLACEPQCD